MSPVTAVALSAVLAGCSVVTSYPEMPPFEGTSILDERLRRDGYAAAFAFAKSNGCSDIDRLVADTASPPLFQPMSLIVTERWVLHGCGRTYSFLVNASGDGQGGTVVDVQSES